MANAQRLNDSEHEQNFGDELTAGSTLMHGQYTIDGFLNAGGFGITYSARDSLDRKVVIKECFPGSFCRRSHALVHARSRAHSNELSSIVRLFVQEAHSLSKLNHPNIVGVHQVFEENNTAYMALDFIEGRDLLEMIEAPEEVLTSEQIETILRKTLDAVGFIHRRGVLHRDISPDNILLDADMNPILIDFGAAREEASKQSRVLSAMRVVKDGYSPQEFYISGSAQGAFSDLYALGATFYHLITGELPPNSQARLSAVAGGQPDPYKPLVGRLPEYRDDFLKAIDASLEILPQDRIETAEAWLDMLDGNEPRKVVPLNVQKGYKAPEKAPATGEKQKSKVAMLLASVALVAGVTIYLGQSQLLGEDGAEASAAATPAADPAVVADAAPLASEAAIVDALVAPADVPLLQGDAPVLDGLETALADSAPLVGGLSDVVVPEFDIASVASPTEDAVVPDAADTLLAAAAASDVVVPDLGLIETAAAPIPTAPAYVEPAGEELYAVRGMLSAWWIDVPSSIGFGAFAGEKGIFEVNGTAVETRAAFDAALMSSMDMPATAELELNVLSGATADSAVAETLVLPVRYKTTFPDGHTFETVYVDNAWQTLVTAVPGAGADIQTGDIMAGSVADSLRFDTLEGFPQAIEAAVLNGDKAMTVAILRAGEMIAVTLPLPTETIASID